MSGPPLIVEPGAGPGPRRGIELPVSAYAGLSIFALLVLAALLQSVISGQDPDRVAGLVLTGPSADHPLGLDYAGRDLLANLIYGARPSLLSGVAAALISGAIGGTLGIAGGYLRGPLERAVTLVTDFFLVIPVLPLMIVLSALYGAHEATLVLIIGCLSWMTTARVLSAQVRSVRERVFVQRVESLGASSLYVMGRHILPHVVPLLVATTALVVGSAIFFESALDFIGLGDPASRSWGNQIAQGFQAGAVRDAAWPAILAPGLAIGLVVLSVNLIGRGIEAAVNPRLRVGGVRARVRTLRLPPRFRRVTADPGA
jgi:peptide/nickel transport system permease protein